MYSYELTPEQCASLLRGEDGHRIRLEKIYFRMVELGFTETDPARVAVRNCILTSRKLCYIWADGLGKGDYCNWWKRARDWKRV